MISDINVASGTEALRKLYADYNALTMAANVLDWDQQCYMPEGGNEARAAHSSILQRMSHEVISGDAFVRALEEAEKEAESFEDKATVRVLRRARDLATKLPSSFVETKSHATSIAHEKWVKARATNDFGSFLPTLEQIFELTRQEADLLGYEASPYDALFDQYEEGATAADARSMFAGLKQPTIDLVKEIAAKGPIDDTFLYGDWDQQQQSIFTEQLVRSIGFDFSRGRQDVAAHPFCTNFSIGDVRLTTRFKNYLPSSIFGSLHEAGHGMYEQGSPMAWDRTPLAGGVSLGVHESQSRTWENIVGRSRSFWNRNYPELQQQFPALASIPLDKFYAAVNKVEPSFIRVEADEVTYNLHVLIRFELEVDILEGRLNLKDLPEAWNSKYEDYLGIVPKNDAEGCLQDVHWSAGLIGYFPTYSMGNLLSYQIWNKLSADLGDTNALIEAGQFEPILTWLIQNVYSKGKSLTPKELVQQVTGKPLAADDYVTGLFGKYRTLYGL